jgi:hypothetical protein
MLERPPGEPFAPGLPDVPPAPPVPPAPTFSASVSPGTTDIITCVDGRPPPPPPPPFDPSALALPPLPPAPPPPAGLIVPRITVMLAGTTND